MYRIKSKVKILYILIDLVFIGISTYVPCILQYNKLNLRQFLTLPTIWNNLNLPSLASYSLVFLFWGLITIFFLHNNGLYGTNRELSIFGETWKVLKSVLFSSLLIATLVFLSKMVIFSRLVFGRTSILIFATLSSWRMIKRCIIRKIVAGGYHNLNVLVIGAGKIGRSLIKEIGKHPYFGLKIVGYLDDFKEMGDKVDGYNILGKTEDFERIVRQEFIDEVFITIPSERKLISNLVTKGRNLGISVKIVPDLYGISMGQMRFHSIGYISLLEYYNKGIHGADLFTKRATDILLSGLGLLLLSPLFLILAIVIKLTSRGPVFYVSRRCGKDKRIFNFYKFRSMVKDAEKILDKLQDKNEMDGPVFKIKNDPRITKIGGFIRRFSVDELPQLWNVFKGDMSLVGPRPPIPEEVEKYEDWQLRRLEIKPGITCLWQIQGRNEISFRQWVDLDIWYIDHWSLWLDLKILFQTIPVVIGRKGAY